MVEYVEGTQKSVTGSDLHTVRYRPDGPVAAILCWHHGIQEHVGRYKPVFETWAAAGIAIYSYDMFGHGRSGGDRAYIGKFSDAVKDFKVLCETAIADAANPTPPVKVFMGGHSLGGLIAATAFLEMPSSCAGLLLCSPALDMEWNPMLRLQAAAGNILASLLPRARIVPAVQPETMNRNPQKVKEYLEDPLNCPGPLPARTANESLKAFRYLGKRRHEVTVPLYAHHGTADACTSFNATKAFVAETASPDKTFVAVEGGYHEVLFEDVGPKLAQDMAAWIIARSRKSDDSTITGGSAPASTDARM